MSDVRPLMHAIQNRDTPAARAALERDESQATDPLPGGLSPLMFALYNGAQEIAELLRAYRPLSLHEAVALDDTFAVARHVLDEPDAIRRHSVDGWTPLHLAAFFGQRDALLTLIGLGAPIDSISENPMQNTPMHAAIAGPAGEQMAPLLIGFGADVHHVGGSGVTALHLAASRDFTGLVRLLMARGVDRTLKTEDDKTAADLARERGHLEVAQLLDNGLQ
ncbi:ankyrin repeat domain-containing protein [Polycyclovorans algicola]|uniref:ankyrin repeat domain-containing protein n=1 Tax=Polycyclovorans algicola TaxID=616992 RepID=UPI000A0238AB|nr:ankyrin repeat domain-containing protein [Polycyclovorans algicola]